MATPETLAEETSTIRTGFRPTERSSQISGLALSGILLTSCAIPMQEPKSVPEAIPPGQTVTLNFDDWRITREGSGPIEAGDITFHLVNRAKRRHEFVLIQLPESGHRPPLIGGRLDEEQFEARQRITEIDELAPNSETSYHLHLPPGRYLIFCNIVEKDGDRLINHYGMGMHTEIELR